jgi:hypothetical protein
MARELGRELHGASARNEQTHQVREA